MYISLVEDVALKIDDKAAEIINDEQKKEDKKEDKKEEKKEDKKEEKKEEKKDVSS